jgi:hypothetical protein
MKNDAWSSGMIVSVPPDVSILSPCTIVAAGAAFPRVAEASPGGTFGVGSGALAVAGAAGAGLGAGLQAALTREAVTRTVEARTRMGRSLARYSPQPAGSTAASRCDWGHVVRSAKHMYSISVTGLCQPAVGCRSTNDARFELE